MTDYTQYVFKATPEMADWIDENIKSWTNDFVYPNLYRMQKKQYQQRLERIATRILVIIMGMVLLSFSYITTNMINYFTVLFGGFLVVLIGFIMLGLEVRNGRNR